MAGAALTCGHVVALCGGVGGAKLAAGLARVVPGRDLAVIVNTADDFRPYGLYVSPDVDTVLYTLAGLANPVTGWGLLDDTANVMTAVRVLGEAPWFHLGDRDLATHLVRTGWLAEGLSFTEVTARLAARLGVSCRILPMSDDPVATVIGTSDGEIAFQEWFARRHCEPPALSVRYEGVAGARATDAVRAVIDEANVIVIAPSNPYLSIGPILALDGVRDAVRRSPAPVVAVSPIVGGRALKGPASQMLTTIAGEATTAAVARLYADILDGLVVDLADALDADEAIVSSTAVLVTDIVMEVDGDRARLARETLDFAHGLIARRGGAGG
jgi:LPPG:FO 2-phospho-L-lactate transferase